MRESDFDIVEVRLASDQSSLEVLRNQKSLSFSEQSWMDLNGEFPQRQREDVCAVRSKKKKSN